MLQLHPYGRHRGDPLIPQSRLGQSPVVRLGPGFAIEHRINCALSKGGELEGFFFEAACYLYRNDTQFSHLS